MVSIIVFLLISQDVIGPRIQEYDINDFSDPTIASGNIEYACWNPAAISNINTLSFAGNIVYTNGNLDLSHLHLILGEDYKHETSEFLPELLGIAFPLNEKFSLGFLFSAPYKHSYNTSWLSVMLIVIDDSLAGVDSVSSNSAIRFYAFNPIISYKIKENLSVGLNFAVLAKKYNAYGYYNTPDSIFTEVHGNYYGIEPNLGIQYQLNEKSRIDLSIKKGFVQGTETWPDEEYSIKEILPLKASLGTKIDITPQLTINNAVEFIHWKGKSFYLNGEKVEYSDYVRNVFRIHIGGEYKIKSKYALRLGIYNYPALSSMSSIKREQIFLTGGIGIELGNLKINFAASSSSLLPTGDKETNNFHLSITY
jgi:long-subunit fatty acid transport protein